MEWQQGAFTLSCDPERNSNWMWCWSSCVSRIGPAGSPPARCKFPYNIRLNFSLFRGPRSDRLCAVVSDRSTFGLSHRCVCAAGASGPGLGKWLVSCVFSPPRAAGVSPLDAGHEDAKTLYARYGFNAFDDSA